MDLSPIGEAVLIAREGRRLTAYRDSKGIWTIGVGHTGAAGPPIVRPGLRLTATECDALFARDVQIYVRAVREALPQPLPQHAFDALVSLCFNIGPGAFLRSSVLRHLRDGDRAEAAEAILAWNRPPEVIPRRRAEYDQFRTAYETVLPRARRSDARPIPPPAGLPSAGLPSAGLPSAKTVPAPASKPASMPPRPAPASLFGRGWRALLSRLRTRPSA